MPMNLRAKPARPSARHEQAASVPRTRLLRNGPGVMLLSRLPMGSPRVEPPTRRAHLPDELGRFFDARRVTAGSIAALRARRSS
jgi:hypothetical protein